MAAVVGTAGDALADARGDGRVRETCPRRASAQFAQKTFTGALGCAPVRAMANERAEASGKRAEAWTVVGEPSIEEVSDTLWIVRGHVPRMPLGRTMVVARMEDRRLLVHNAIALPPADQKRLDRHGEIGFIVVPSAMHRIDARRYAERYPDAEIVCPAGAKAKVEEVVPVDLTYDQFEGDSVVSLRHVPGVADKEGVLTVNDEGERTLVFNDLLFNVDHMPGFFGLVSRMIGSTGGPRVTWLFRRMVLEDKEALRVFLQRLSATEGLARLVPGHGKVIGEAAGPTLAAVAERL